MANDLDALVFLPRTAPAVVFALLTDTHLLSAWFAEAADVDLSARSYAFWGRCTPETPKRADEVSSVIRFSAPIDGAAETTVLSISWYLRGVATRVEYSLTARDGGTQLRVVHSGLPERTAGQGALHDFWIAKLEALRLYALTGRSPTQLKYDSQPGASIKLALEISASAPEVFRYLIEPEYVAKLWDDEHVVIEPHAGGKYDYGWEKGGPKQILELDAPRRLSFSWCYPPETEDTTVTWRLAEQDGITYLSLEHSGFAPDASTEDYRAGWFSFLAVIQALVELGPDWTRVVVQGIEHGAV
jgi:uncharacterized protein YndB with AHSA1/START domain